MLIYTKCPRKKNLFASAIINSKLVPPPHTPISNNVISRAILPQALVDFAGPKCHDLCHDYERNNPVQHQTKPKGVLYFDSICRESSEERTNEL